MGRPLDVKELLLLKSKANDIELLLPKKKTNVVKHTQLNSTEPSKSKDEGEDLEDLILNLQTSKKVDKLTKIPKRSKAFSGDSSAEASFESLLKNKPLDQMTKTCWDMYAKLNRIEINTLVNDKRYHPIRKLDDHEGYLKLDTITQYTLNEFTQEGKNKGLVCIDNTGVAKIDILSIVLPVVLFLKQNQNVKITEKTPLCCVVVNDEEQKEEIWKKIDYLQNSKFRELRGLKQSFYVNTVSQFANDINTNHINYHINLKWIVFDYLDLNKLKMIDDILVNIKNRKITKVFYIRRQYNLSLQNKTEVSFDETLDKLIDSLKPGNNTISDDFKFKSKMFNEVNLLKIR